MARGPMLLRMEPTKILQITAATVAGARGTFVNIYGLDTESRVWQWNAKLGKWVPNKVKPREDAVPYRGGSAGSQERRDLF